MRHVRNYWSLLLAWLLHYTYVANQSIDFKIWSLEQFEIFIRLDYLINEVKLSIWWGWLGGVDLRRLRAQLLAQPEKLTRFGGVSMHQAGGCLCIKRGCPRISSLDAWCLAALLSIISKMDDHSTTDGDPRTKASSISESGARKFTLSCSRCRSSKLKCDKREPCVCCPFLMQY